LEAHELIKMTILSTADDDARNLAENVAELLEAIPVAVIGRKAIFYRRSSRENFAHLELWTTFVPFAFEKGKIAL